jgi:nickel/cobalt transporter (NicO) family protein
MKARLLALAAAMAVLAAFAPAASAHPLGNFSLNHLTQVRVSADRVEALYILDQAEIPTFQERGLSSTEVLARKREAVTRGVHLEVNGRAVPLRFDTGGKISFPAGQGGLKLTRVEFPLSAEASEPRRVVFRDNTFRDRVGWKAIQIQPGTGTAVRSSVYSQDPTNGLRTYPKDTLSSPLDQRTATLSVSPGGGTVKAPTPPPDYRGTTSERSGDGFAGVFSDAAAGDGVLLLLLLVAFGWGALHALSPGHGKAMVAAYLIGTRGTARHAVGLGAIVTVTHTIGVFMLGFVTLLLSQYILPEDLYPWLNLIAGVLVVSVGLGVLRSRIRFARGRPSHADGHEHHHGHEHGHRHEHHGHDHDHGHDRGRGHGHEHARDHHHHGDGHGHSHDIPDRVTWRGLVGMGTAAGLIPCPSALVVLLGAIAQHQVGLGLVLIVAFSLGLATTLTALGLAVVYARRALTKVRVPGRLVAALPAASAVLIVGVGLVLTAQAIPKF